MKEYKFINNIETYRSLNNIALFLDFSILVHTFQKLLFNGMTTTGRLPFDKWTIIDTVSSILSIISIIVVSNLSPEDFMNTKKKDWIDYLILLVLIVTWIRFFSFFLVIRDISKLLLTLVAMIADTLAFILIVF